ncbi:MAG: hypothetical protein H6738_08840 [Alphaproteobacteria bacterium]|nr:hypothetical protein [Alphaproteobacteria bacterium]MCB9696867.1 hypothetical protein [Alphaproteobacteria bacterium]
MITVLLAIPVADARPRPRVGPTVHVNVNPTTIGRPQWLDFAGFDPGGVVVTATDADGHQAPSWTWHLKESLLMPIPPSGSGTVDVASRVWIDVPGEWTIRVASVSKPDQVATTTLTVLPATPEVLEDIVDGHHGRSPAALGHAAYVPILEARIRGSAIGERPRAEDTFAISALRLCPCVESAEALLRVWDAHPNLRSTVVWALAPRVVADQWTAEPLLRDRGWVESLDPALLERVRAEFEMEFTASEVECGILEAIGDASDGPLVEAATVRALGEGNGRLVLRLEALRVQLGAPRTSDDPSVALLDRLVAWDGQAGEPPVDYEEALIEALTGPNEALREVASLRLPPVASDALLHVALTHLGTVRVGGMVEHWLRKLPPQQVRGAIARELESVDASRVPALLTAAADVLAPDELVDQVLAHLERPDPDPALSWVLVKAVDASPCREWGRQGAEAGDPAVLTAAWRRVLDQHRDELHVARLRWVPGVTDPDLLPPGFRCGPTPRPTE